MSSLRHARAVRLEEIHLRDPFVVPVPETSRYLLFGTTGRYAWSGAEGFEVYTSPDLVEWSGPEVAFVPPEGFWATTNFWAPEVHRHGDRWVMLASFKAEGVCRGTQVLVADRPEGPYAPLTAGPVTPCAWECLDGTLWWEDGEPWMVFCHEWLQIGDGTIDAVRLSPDLSRAVGEPLRLFSASDARWRGEGLDPTKGVTDGPWLHRTRSGALLMLWSTNSVTGYALGVARSTSGSVAGPWTHDHPPLFTANGGHGMLFRTFDGGLKLALHHPNTHPDERPVFLSVEESGDELRVKA